MSFLAICSISVRPGGFRKVPLGLPLLLFGKGIVDAGHCPTSSRLLLIEKEVFVLLRGYQRQHQTIK